MENLKSAYFVCFSGCTSGSFISSLIFTWLDDYKHKIAFSQFGDTHDSEIFKDNWHDCGTEAMEHVNFKQPIAYIRKLYEQKPFVLRQHNRLNHNIAKQYIGDNYLNIDISFNPETDYQILGAFTWFKHVLRDYALNSPNYWNGLKEKDVDPYTLKGDELKYYINKLIELKGFKNYVPWTKPEEHENTINLRFSEILFSKDRVLERLSNAIERPIIPHITQIYDNYLFINRTLVRHHCPWIYFP